MLKYGQAEGSQRYYCKNCGKTFTATTGTQFYCIKKPERFIASIQCLLDNQSVRVTASKLQVCSSTAFKWRHKMMSAIASTAPEKVYGLVHCDGTELKVSMKGCRQLKRPP